MPRISSFAKVAILLSGFRENLGRLCARTDSWRCCSSSRRRDASPRPISPMSSRSPNGPLVATWRPWKGLSDIAHSQAGRGGGWLLVGGARTDLSGLTAAEARTLFLVAGPWALRHPADQGRAPQARSRTPGVVPSAGGVGGRGGRAGPHELGPFTSVPASRAPRGPAERSRRGRRAGAPSLCRPRSPARDRASGASAGSGGQGVGLVPGRRNRRGPSHVPAQPHPRRQPSRPGPAHRTSGGLRSRGDLEEDRGNDRRAARKKWSGAVALADPEAVRWLQGAFGARISGRRPGFPAVVSRWRSGAGLPMLQPRTSSPSRPGSRCSRLTRSARSWRNEAPT